MICYASLALFVYNILKLDISHAFLRVTIAELSTLKQVRFFWPTLYLVGAACVQWKIGGQVLLGVYTIYV